MKKILVTGHEGLVGTPLVQALEKKGYQIIGLDINAKNNHFKGDINNDNDLIRSLQGVVGVIHLAAVSRVIWGQQDPEKCMNTNFLASQKLIQLAIESNECKWCLVASSREVYGEQKSLPVNESQILAPVNVYGEAKLKMEKFALDARSKGLNTAIVRLANVYGNIDDHSDRVLPAFCRAAVLGESLRVDGAENTFDFTHIDDTIIGMLKIITRLENGDQNIPPLHLLPGIGTTLQQAAQMAIKAANSSSQITYAPSRNYDVSKFIGDPTLASNELDWSAKISPDKGIQLLVNKFKKSLITKGEKA